MNIAKIRKVKTPCRATPGSAGFDFFIPEDLDFYSVSLSHGESILIPSGIVADIPKGFMLLGLEKSGLGLKGCSVGARVIDSDYQGEIHLHVFNHSSRKTLVLKAGEKMVQFVLIPVFLDSIEIVDRDKLFPKETTRGEKGFNSTGSK